MPVFVKQTCLPIASSDGEESVLNSSSPLPYMPQLDAIRAFAVLAVMLSHFGLDNLGESRQLGVWGVRLFFVLSGFLITGILLKERLHITSRHERRLALRRFYFRRALRILPLFYFVLAVTAILNFPYVREIFWWHLTYTSNFLFSLRGGWQGPSSHLWSLAVEEQFYLVWPWLILFLPKQCVLPAIAIAIAVSPLYKVLGNALQWNETTLLVMTPSCLDTLGLGALLAWCRHQYTQSFEALARCFPYRVAGCLLFLLMLIALPVPRLVSDIMQALFFTWVVHCAAVGFTGVTGRFLQLKPLLACGRISYGLYVYHNFMPFLVSWALSAVGIATFENAGLYTGIVTVATFAAAILSWCGLENPLMRLKNHFNYVA